MLLALAATAAMGQHAPPPAAAASTATAPTELDSIIARIDAGDFRQATTAIDQALARPDVSAPTRQALAFQRERMRRILLDFTLTRAEVEARVRKQIPDLTAAEFARWDNAGLLERMNIDGRTLYFKRAPGNLFRLSAEALGRRAVQSPLSAGPMESLNAEQRAVYHAALSEKRSSVLPRRVRMTQTLTVNADAVPAGETVRAWIPYPRAVPGQQQDIVYVASQPAAHRIAPESAPQRTVYLEQPAVAGRKSVFSVTYEVTLLAQYHAIDADKVQALSAVQTSVPVCVGDTHPQPCSPFPVDADLAPWLGERPPHIVFTPAMRAFSRQVVGEETNPYRIAQKLFAAVDRIPWAGAREYSTISNISDYARAFVPAKRQFRSDDVDSQRGEAEWRGGNIYFDQLDYDFHWQMLPAPATAGPAGRASN
jgi:hypothetical protein